MGATSLPPTVHWAGDPTRGGLSRRPTASCRGPMARCAASPPPGDTGPVIRATDVLRRGATERRRGSTPTAKRKRQYSRPTSRPSVDDERLHRLGHRDRPCTARAGAPRERDRRAGSATTSDSLVRGPRRPTIPLRSSTDRIVDVETDGRLRRPLRARWAYAERSSTASVSNDHRPAAVLNSAQERGGRRTRPLRRAQLILRVDARPPIFSTERIEHDLDLGHLEEVAAPRPRHRHGGRVQASSTDNNATATRCARGARSSLRFHREVAAQVGR